MGHRSFQDRNAESPSPSGTTIRSRIQSAAPRRFSKRKAIEAIAKTTSFHCADSSSETPPRATSRGGQSLVQLVNRASSPTL